MKKIRVSAPGKIHLLGEHVVVYGKPSIIGAVDKRCFVEIISRKDNVIEVVDSRFRGNDRGVRIDEREILVKTKNARKKWEEFSKINDRKILVSITKNPLDYAEICVGETLLYYKKRLSSGFTLTINSEVSSGMGSSSSLAVAVAGAITLFLEKPFDKKIINEIAYLCEQKQHGFPSGGDNSASCFGGFIWYQKKSPNEKIIKNLPLKLSDKIAKNFFLVNTGKPKESTGEMVSLVKSFVQKNQKLAEEIFTDQEKLVKNLLSALKKGDENSIVQIIKSGEKNLEKLGVVSNYVKKIIRDIEKSGGTAKICGAGGITEEAGMVLVYYKDRNVLNDLLKRYNLACSNAALGSEGAKIH